MGTPSLRPGTAEDAAAVADIWHSGWHDVHPGRVPDGLTARRTLEAFHERARARVADTTVATVDDEVAGFIMVVDDEVEQVYVAAAHRGGGLAGMLLDEAERQVAAGGHRIAWLAVVVGNDRARAVLREARLDRRRRPPLRGHRARPDLPVPVPSLHQAGALAERSGSVLVEPPAQVGADARAGDVLVAPLLDPLAEHGPAALDRPVAAAPVERLLPRRLARRAPLGQAEREVADDPRPQDGVE